MSDETEETPEAKETPEAREHRIRTGDKLGHKRIVVEPQDYPVIQRSISTYQPDGAILMAKNITDDDIEGAGGPYGLYVDGFHDPNTMYVKDGVATKRPDNPTLLTGTTLYNVPLPATLRIGDQFSTSQILEVPVTDSTVELNFPIPGTYGVRVHAFPYVDALFTVVAP